MKTIIVAVVVVLLGVVTYWLGAQLLSGTADTELTTATSTDTSSTTATTTESPASTTVTPDTVTTGTVTPPGVTGTSSIEPDTVTVSPVPVPVPTPEPTPTPTPSPVPEPEPEEDDGTFMRSVGQREGSFLIQAVLPDRVNGLWFTAYPVPREEGEPRTLRVGDDIGYACEGVSIKVLYLDSVRGRVTFQKKTSPEPMGGCPICLSSEARIATPSGEVLVTELAVGDAVLTVDRNGEVVATTVEKTGNTAVPAAHQVVVLKLSDGRSLSVSSGHDTTDGRTVGELAVGDTYDGAEVIGVTRKRYLHSHTYDLLPAGETGFYYANGILLGSTLK